MKFEISEYRNKLKSSNKFLNFLIQLFVVPIVVFAVFFIILPILFIKNIFSKEGKKEKKLNEFHIKFQNENIVIEQKFIDEKEYPDDLDYEDGDAYLFIYKSNPELSLFKERYFNYNFHETQWGIYLISYNKQNEGMYLWYIDKTTLHFQKIRNLISSTWNFKNENGKIILTTETHSEEIKIEINQF